MFTDFLSLADLTTANILALLELADLLKADLKAGKREHPLEGQTLAMIFEKPSLRTRVTFETGISQLGGHGIMLETGHIRLGERESVPDVARNLERWVDGIVARTFSHETVEQLAAYARIPVINALTDKLHPCQILADAQALREHKGAFENLKLTFVGDGNNVCASWFHFAARVPLNVTLVCPPGYEVDQDIFRLAQREGKGEVTITHQLEEGLAGADAVYADVWASMGQEAESAERAKAFAGYQVSARVMGMAKPDAVFMHCLPAHRGEEVTNEVMDSPQSIVFDQAENRLHAQKAVMLTLMKKDARGLNRKQKQHAGA
ncbi:MAG TPA: ornithine carbamoyltransferase [Candidatus Hydrogenedentes bacterium]|nr:ornithine carbamoyltransferase [Candidatus Hydrogenedentota bacterium]HQE82877.1 ornithine carbamoyltransferase [Candidatus Hydrogenedentota bacterium]HQM47405.1 ornithine carbamoyltransferase [Candidatus Hydrogenedentota bacterium]